MGSIEVIHDEAYKGTEHPSEAYTNSQHYDEPRVEHPKEVK